MARQHTTPDALAAMAAPIYAALIAPWAQLVVTEGGATRAAELRAEALKHAAALHAGAHDMKEQEHASGQSEAAGADARHSVGGHTGAEGRSQQGGGEGVRRK